LARLLNGFQFARGARGEQQHFAPLAAAQRFVAERAFVYIFARRQEEPDKTAASIGRNIAGVQGDVGKLEDLHRFSQHGGNQPSARTAACTINQKSSSREGELTPMQQGKTLGTLALGVNKENIHGDREIGDDAEFSARCIGALL
jgi:NAD(P)-dependent dehydrogenase (short-subunit alcohol dehydrogenase family)